MAIAGIVESAGASRAAGDVGAAEAELKARLDDAKRQAADLGQKARDAADRAREQARQSAAAASAAATAATSPPSQPHAPPAFTAAPTRPEAREAPADSTMPAMAKALACPQCLTAVGRDDAFCGVCGHKLK